MERTTAWSALALLVYTGWARSGVYGPWHKPIWGLFALLLSLFIFSLFKTWKKEEGRDDVGGQCGHRPSSRGLQSLFKDPLFYIGLLFSVLLLIQWQNQGGIFFRNAFTGEYQYSGAPHPNLPFSADALSRQQLVWFIPAWVLLLTVRHLFSSKTRKWLIWAMLWNGLALAVFGLLQFALGWTELFNLIEITNVRHLVSTFDYANHGGAFFYLLYALCIGLLIDALEKQKSVLQMALPSVLGVVFGAAALQSLSRAAVLAVIAITLSGLLVWTGLTYQKFTTTSWVNLGIFGGVLAVLFLIGVLSIGDGAVMDEFSADQQRIDEEQGPLEYYRENRGFQIPPAFDMLKAYPWFGVGGWGYRQFLKCYTTDEIYVKYLGTGRANVHCDPVQFLAEHGAVGFGFMSAAMAVVLWPWRKLKQWRFKGLALMTLCGTGIIFLHSWIDLPFRCPTVLWHWLLLLAIVPMLAGRSLRSVSCA